MFMEALGEIGGAAEADTVSDLRHGATPLFQQFGSMEKTEGADEVARGLTGQRFYLTVHLRDAESGFQAELLRIEFRIGMPVPEGIDGSLQKSFVHGGDPAVGEVDPECTPGFPDLPFHQEKLCFLFYLLTYL